MGCGLFHSCPSSDQPMAAPVVGAKACDSIAVVVKFHLVEPAGVEGCRLIVDTVMGAVLHDNGVRAGGPGPLRGADPGYTPAPTAWRGSGQAENASVSSCSFPFLGKGRAEGTGHSGRTQTGRGYCIPTACSSSDIQSLVGFSPICCGRAVLAPDRSGLIHGLHLRFFWILGKKRAAPPV